MSGAVNMLWARWTELTPKNGTRPGLKEKPKEKPKEKKREAETQDGAESSYVATAPLASQVQHCCPTPSIHGIGSC